MKPSVARRAVLTLLVGNSYIASACAGGHPEEVPAAELDVQSVLLEDAGILRAASVVQVFGEADDLLTEGIYVGSARSMVQLAGLPADWVWIGFYRKQYRVFGPLVLEGRVVRAEGSSLVPGPPGDPSAWPKWLMLGLFVILSVYAVLMTGMSGGPNHGEHPLLIHLVYLGAWMAISPVWPTPFGSVFVGLLVAGMVLSIPVMGIRVWSHPKATLVARIVYGFIFAGMFAVMVWPKPPAVTGERTGTTAVVLHASANMSELAVWGGSGDVLYRTPAVGRHALLFVAGDGPAVSVQLSFAQGDAAVVELPDQNTR